MVTIYLEIRFEEVSIWLPETTVRTASGAYSGICPGITFNWHSVTFSKPSKFPILITSGISKLFSD